ncbi:MAG TPA: serine/threonine-protein kinase [Gemmataceae bacterium]|nr:serine/threonine-protein kinase [Gemmataceae bacterium]
MKFTYSSGQRPLEGFTIKRGIGRGGFGEVYYGLSDGGKEVALKLVRSNLDIELRGISQCLNFKHPNLVNLYDLRTDNQDDTWVVMEYVAGETLSTILNRHPQGLPAELARQWFAGLAAAVSYLHDHGIVHRDLKPGNIFLENGNVKVGDYGLCKFISSSQHNAQTQSVGTVHYMAPEISTGNYNKQIDIYAAGILLYEMLTGRVPFEGESAAEILMKHLTSPPDLSKLPFEFVPIISKALTKNPAHRYRTMAEMAKEVAALGGTAEPVKAVPRPAPLPQALPAPPPPAALPVIVPLRTRVLEMCGSMAMAALLAALLCTVWAAVRRTNDLTEIGGYFFLTVAACWAVIVPARLWTTRVEDSWRRRVLLMCLGVGIGLEALWLEGYELPDLLQAEARASAQVHGLQPVGLPEPVARRGWSLAHFFREGPDLPVAACYLSYFGLAFFALRWWKMADRRRAQRFSLFAVLAAGFWGYLLLLLWPRPSAPVGFVSLIMTSVIVQLVSPWEQPPPPPSRRLRLRYA